MEQTAFFSIRGNLNDFIPRTKRQEWIPYAFKGQPSVKDAVEALGVPHPEIFYLLEEHAPLPFSYLLVPGDRITVHGMEGRSEVLPGVVPLQPPPPAPRFILDVHLGTLARKLRLLGLDTVYEKDYNDREIAARAAAEERILLSRDTGLLKHKHVLWGYWLRSQDGDQQLEEVRHRFSLDPYFQPFRRCLLCNGLNEPVNKELISGLVPKRTLHFFEAFFRCAGCGNVYWQGSHYDRMLAWLQKLEAGKVG